MKRNTTATAILALLALVLPAVLAACNLPLTGSNSNKDSTTSRINTASALTIAAKKNIEAGNTPVPVQPTIAIPGQATPVPPTPVPSTTAGDPSIPCNRAEFVRDVTINDGDTIPPNSIFSKTWELKNSGSCVWTSSYAIVFAGSGTSMSAPAANPFPENTQIKPGESVQVKVTMRAPSEPGEYKGYWMLRGDDQKPFGLGANAAGPFYVQIQVGDTYSFAENVCSAAWSNASGPLPCPGKEGDAAGYVLQQEDPILEDNQTHEGFGLLTMPQLTAGGEIIGKYPAVIVPPESDFRAIISCLPNATGCYLRFKVTYRIDDGEEQLLGEWNEGYEGGVTNAIKDLDAASGRSTAFTFYVTVLGTPNQSKGLWFDPRITR